MDVAVSIIIPVYNVEQYLEQCIESAMEQTLKSIEIILVDDGSTDNSGYLCDNFAKVDNRIKVIHKKNGGLSDARNHGAKVAKGKYIYFLDSDDWIEKYAIESLYEFGEKNDLDLILFDSRVVDENGNDCLDPLHTMRYYRINEYNGVFSGPTLFSKMISNKEHYSSVPLLFIKKDSFMVKFENMLHEDELFTVKLLYSVNRVAYYPEMLYVRRVRRGSIMTVSKTVNHYRGMKAVIEGLISLENRDEAVLRYVCTILQCTELIFHELSKNDKKIVIRERNELLKSIKCNKYYSSKRLRFITRNIKLYPLYNSLFNNQNSFCYKIVSRILQHKRENKQLYTKILPNDKRFFIIGVPTHGNLGDHAIAVSQLKLLTDCFPEYTIYEIDRATYIHRKHYIKRMINANDILFIPGGGWLGNQWYHNQLMVEDVINRFPNNKIVILPQTIFFQDTKDRKLQVEKARRTFSKSNVLLFLREKKSYEFAKQNLNVHCNLVPDLVLRLTYNEKHTRSGISICFREDCEQVINKGDKEYFINYLKKTYDDIKNTTTVIGNIPLDKREFAVAKKLREFSRTKIVITDRLHAMIFAALTATPCVAFDNSSNKVTGVYEWIKSLDYIKIVDNVDDAIVCVEELIKMNKKEYHKPDFKQLESEISSFIYS